MSYQLCSLNVSPTNDRVIACDNTATVKVREQRSPQAAKKLGRDFTIHQTCPSCAKVLTANPKFTITN